MIKENTACFTGHRPEKTTIPEDLILNLIEIEVKKNINKYQNYICGASRGFDLLVAKVILSLGLNLITALPYESYSVKDTYWKSLYEYTLNNSKIIILDDKYNINSYKKRDCWMVDNSSLLIAHYEGIKGGTENTINYAKEKKIEIRFI